MLVYFGVEYREGGVGGESFFYLNVLSVLRMWIFSV